MDGEHDMLFDYMHLHRAFFECMRMSMKGLPLHPQQTPMLIMLSKHSGISQSQMTRKLGVSAATVAVSIARREKLGLVSKTKNPDNHRQNIIALTKEGQHQTDELQAIMHRVGMTAIDGFSPTEVETIKRYLRHSLKNLEQCYQSKEGQNNDA